MAQEGWFMVPNTIFFDGNLHVTDKIVLVYLYHCAGPDGYACASYFDIALATGLSRRTVVSSIQRLATAGWLVREHRRSRAGNPESNTYRLLFTANGASTAPQGGSATVAPPPQGGSAAVALGSATVALPPGVVQQLHYPGDRSPNPPESARSAQYPGGSATVALGVVQPLHHPQGHEPPSPPVSLSPTPPISLNPLSQKTDIVESLRDSTGGNAKCIAAQVGIFGMGIFGTEEKTTHESVAGADECVTPREQASHQGERPRRRSRRADPDPRIRPFFEAWDEIYRKHMGSPYPFTAPKRDGEAIRKLPPEYDLDRLVKLAKLFFKLRKEDHRGWWRKRDPTIAGFVASIPAVMEAQKRISEGMPP